MLQPIMHVTPLSLPEVDLVPEEGHQEIQDTLHAQLRPDIPSWSGDPLYEDYQEV